MQTTLHDCLGVLMALIAAHKVKHTEAAVQIYVIMTLPRREPEDRHHG